MGYSDPVHQRDYQRRWVAARRATYFKGKCCSTCGTTEELQLHHLDPAEKLERRPLVGRGPVPS